MKTWRYRSPASGPSEEAVLITAIVASRPPASATNRLRMTRSRTLSSAPPMTMTVPSVTACTTPHGSTEDTGPSGAHQAREPSGDEDRELAGERQGLRQGPQVADGAHEAEPDDRHQTDELAPGPGI